MPLFTPDQIAELTELVEHYHLFFLAEHLGTGTLTAADRAVLEAAGFDLSALDDDGVVDLAFRFGLVSQQLSDRTLQKLTYDEMRRHIERGGAVPLSEPERDALQAAKTHAYYDIKGLGNRVSARTGQLLIEADQKQRAAYEKTIRTNTERAVRLRQTASWLASELGHATQDWSRDFDRIADFVLHSALDHGRAESIRRQYGDDAQVFKSVYPRACRHCQRLLLTAGAGSQPRLFALRELLANGTNVGRPVAEWKAVVGPQHPWCRCTLHYADTAANDYDPQTGGWTKAKPYVSKRGRLGVTITLDGAATER
jgi:hypothetical protein